MQEAPPPSDPIPPKPSDERRAEPTPPTSESANPQTPPIIELPAEMPASAGPFAESPVRPSSEQPAPPPPPPAPVFVAPSARVTEVETSPVTPSDVRGPVIDVAAQRPTPPPEPKAPPPFTVPPPMSGTAAGASTGQPSAPPPPSGAPPYSPPPPAPPSAFRRYFWAVVSHLLLLLVIPTLFLGASLTFLIWQLAGRKDALVEDQGREALNFQINVAGVTALLGLSCIGAPLVCIAWFVAIVMSIIAAIHAGRGERYRYPWCLRIVTH